MMRTISDIAVSLRNGKSVKQSADAGGLPITRIETIADGVIDPQRVGFANLQKGECTDWLLQEGDILISHINSTKHLGKCAIYEGEPAELVHGMNLLGLRVNPECADSRFTYRMLSSPGFRRQLPSITKNSVNQSSFNISNFKKLQIPLPPLAEQKRIAAILDAADALRAKRRAALAQLDALVQSTFLEMFGDPVTNPKGWDECTVGDVTDCIVPGRDKPKSFTGSTPWITTDDLVHLGVTIYSSKGIGLTLKEIGEVKARVIPKGSVVISCVGDLGISSIAGSDMVVNQQLHTFQCGDWIEKEFLSYCLPFQKPWMKRRATQTTLPYLNKTNCNSIPIVVPPVMLQDRFASIVQSIEQQKALQRTHLAELDALFASLQHRAFSGEL